jgi:hypothetical protein
MPPCWLRLSTLQRHRSEVRSPTERARSRMVGRSLEYVVNCHGSMCRKATGAAFRTRAKVLTVAVR